MSRPRVAVFRPDDDRLDRAVALLRDLDVEPVPDPLLAVEPTSAMPGSRADIVVLTSRTGVDLVTEAGWEPGEARLAAIGPRTAEALEANGFEVDVVPDTASSSGLVAALSDTVADVHVEVARSDHGSDVLLDGLTSAGATVTETVLYRLVRPPNAGHSTELAAAGELDAALFTSSLTVEHWLAAADDRGVLADAKAGLNDTVIGAIGDPTRETALANGLHVDIVPEETTFEALARDAVDRLASR